MELEQPFSERVMRPVIQRLARVGRRQQEGGMVARIDSKLERAGYPGGLRGADWVGVKLLALIAFAIIGFLLALLLSRGTFQLALLGLLVGGAVGYLAPEFWLGRKMRARSTAMMLQLPDALDLLTISVEAGLGFDAALAKVVEKMEGPLVDEFRQALAEVRMGRSRRDALAGRRQPRPTRSRSATSSAPSCRPSSSAFRSPRCSRSSRTSCASSAASAPRRPRPRRR